MKVRIQYTVDVDPDKYRQEFCSDESARAIRDYFNQRALTETLDYINQLDIAPDHVDMPDKIFTGPK